MRTFYDELQRLLASAAGHDLQERDLGTLDIRIRSGEDWDTGLGDALATNKSFVAIMTPRAFGSANCGKEFATFVERISGLVADDEGQLKNVRNVLLIRWLQPRHYLNGQPDGWIPKAIRRINDGIPTPRAEDEDPELAEAVRYYNRLGMELCVDKPFFRRLIDELALAIRDMPDLPSASVKDWHEMFDGFRGDWKARFAAREAESHSGPVPVSTTPPIAARPGPSITEVVEPRPLTSLVIFHLTEKPVTAIYAAALFADGIVAEPAVESDPDLRGLLDAIREAAEAEGISTVHCVARPAVPASEAHADALVSRLGGLSDRHVLVALAIDPDLLLGASITFLRRVADSPNWTGPVLLPTYAGGIRDPVALLDARRRGVHLLSEDAGARRLEVAQMLHATRQQVLDRLRAARGPASEPIPVLRTDGGRAP
jgi:hypothetical protein